MEQVIGWLSPSKSFYSRVLFLLLPFTALVCVLYSIFIRSSILFVEDQIIEDYLYSEWRELQLQSQDSGQTLRLPNTSYLTSFNEDSAALPTEIKNLPVGLHEFLYNNDGDEDDWPNLQLRPHFLKDKTHDYHLLVAELTPSIGRIYLLLNENRLSSVGQYDDLIQSMIVAIAGLVLIMGSLLAITLARYISGPIHTLSQEVQQADVGHDSFSGQQRQDEIGKLANSFSALLNKLKQALDREKAFTRHASHELRTPLAAANNALAVLQLAHISPDKKRDNLTRLKKSLSEMDTLIQVFLYLGREQKIKNDSPLALDMLIDSCRHKYAHQLQEGQFFNVCLEQKQVVAHKALMQVLLDNLIRNAIYHGRGAIDIHCAQNKLTISNLCHETESGHGYGLEIVQRICDAMGWPFHYQRVGQRFMVELECGEGESVNQ